MKMTGKLTVTLLCGNDDWFDVIDAGLDAQPVTGGMIELPQKGERKSKAAAIGGLFFGSIEIGTNIGKEIYDMIEGLLTQDIYDTVNTNGFDGLYSNIQNYEFFYTNLARSRLIVAADEFKDNPDEVLATNEVINSIRVSILIEGVPSTNDLMEIVANTLQSAGGAQ